MGNFALEYMKSEDKFIEMFGHGIPTEMLPDCVTKEDIFDKMKICIEKKQDILLELFGVTINENEIY